MMPSEARQFALLLCLLLACTPTRETSGSGPAQVASRAAPLSTWGWSTTREMGAGRKCHTATLLPNGKVLVVGGQCDRWANHLASAELYDPATGTWSSTGSLAQPRGLHTATLLPNGKVLVVGGGFDRGAALDSAELYDPATGTWFSTGSLSKARLGHTATLLPDGKVLVAGGGAIDGYNESLDSAELYDPATGTWSSTGSLRFPRYLHTATLLSDGSVFVMGGIISASFSELYNPATGTWSPADSQPEWEPREGHTATLLPGGKVLIVGGKVSSFAIDSEVYDPATRSRASLAGTSVSHYNHSATLLPDGKVLIVGGRDWGYDRASAALFDPVSGETGTWSSAGSLTQGRSNHTATLLPNGKVLVVGGSKDHYPLASVEVYDPEDPTTRAWSPTGSLVKAHSNHTATPLPDGKLLVVGGFGSEPALGSVEVYEPTTGVWSSTGSLTQARRLHTATLLPNGKVLVAGGRSSDSSLGSVEVYDPLTGAFSPARPLTLAREHHTATLLPDGKVLVVGGFNAGPRNSAEMYDPETGKWSVVRSMNEARYGHTATLLPGGRVLVTGGFGDSGILASAEVFDPTTETWLFLGLMGQPRYGHTATLLPNGKVLTVGGRSIGDLEFIALNSAEVFDPDTGSWSPILPMTQARVFHSATPLPNGKVLVAGGSEIGTSLDSVEVYDPAIRVWSSTGGLLQPRAEHTTSLLPNGKLLVVGGYRTDGTNLDSAELYMTTQGDDAWRPVITDVRSIPQESGTFLVVIGERFRGPSEGSGGTTQSSATNYPLLSLRSVENGLWVPLLGHDFTNTFVTAMTLSPLPSGYYLLSVTTGGLTSFSRMIFIGGAKDDPDFPETILISSSLPAPFTPNTTATFSFASDPGASFDCRLGRQQPFTPCLNPHTYSSLEDGDYTFQVRARWLAGHVDPTPAEYHWTVDGTAPDTGLELASVPPALTNLPSVRFSFFASEQDVTFACSLDGAPFTPCTNPQGHDSLAEGPHTFRVKATDRAGNVDATPSTYSWVVDTVAPGTDLTSTPPALTRAADARFSFSTEPGASFECRLNDAAFSPCVHPHTYFSLGHGDYTFQVRARDAAGNVDSTPAEHRWTVDRTAPETGLELASAPPARTNHTSVRLSFSASEQGTSFACSLDGAAFTPCTSPQDYSNLEEGPHTFEVKATDAAGNVDPTSAEHRWTVDTTPPPRPDLQVPTPNQRLFTPRPVFSGTAEPGSTVRVLVDDTLVGETQANVGGYWELTSPPLDWKTHTATATATDQAGNTSDPSLEASFATVQKGYYGCAAGPSAWLPWPLALLLLGLPRRRRPC